MRNWLRGFALRLHQKYAGPCAEEHVHSIGRRFWAAARFIYHRFIQSQPPLLLTLDAPPRLSGFAAITGWAVSRAGAIRAVEAWIDNELVYRGPLTEWRDDVVACYPKQRWRGPSGFRIAPLPGFLLDGAHSLVIHAVDSHNLTAELRATVEIRDYRLADTGALPRHLTGSNREYQIWLREEAQCAVPTVGPLLTVVMPVYRPNLEFLQQAVESVRGQAYDRWELCICDDGSQQPALTSYLNHLTDIDKRIRVRSFPSNRGISAATNAAVEMGRGGYVAFLDQDDRLAPKALAEVAVVLQSKVADLVYSDEDRIDAHGCRVEPFFKPDWSPDLLRSMMYIAHLCVFRREFLERIGLCRSEFDGAQDWDLALRATEQTDRIHHIPKILYHWRQGGNSAGAAFNRTCHERGRCAITESVARGSENAEIMDGPNGCTFHVRHRHPTQPLVSILIPTRDNERMLAACIRSIRRRTDYANYEIIVIDNGSRESGTLRYLRRCRERVLRLDMSFNHSRLNNLAAQEARGSILLLLNDDTEVINRDWLTALVEQAQRPSVGAVGAWLFHRDGRTQHAGIILGGDSIATPLHSGITRDGIDRGTVRLIRNVSAVTGACLMIRKALYEQMGGLDEVALPTSFNDVDLCLRLRKAGYQIVTTPLARLYHHESASRVIGDELPFVQIMNERWEEILKDDLFWNRNLCRTATGFAFRWDEVSPAFNPVMLSPAVWAR